LTHGGGRDAQHDAHFFSPFANFAWAVMPVGSVVVGAASVSALGLSHGRPFEREAVDVVDEAIGDGGETEKWAGVVKAANIKAQ
jgi:hypothetical protein